MKSNFHHCCGCARLIDCPDAFKVDSCEYYLRNSYFPCHRCLNFGKKPCRDSGLVECNFLPRATWDPLEILNKKLKEIENEKKG